MIGNTANTIIGGTHMESDGAGLLDFVRVSQALVQQVGASLAAGGSLLHVVSGTQVGGTVSDASGGYYMIGASSYGRGLGSIQIPRDDIQVTLAAKSAGVTGGNYNFGPLRTKTVDLWT